VTKQLKGKEQSALKTWPVLSFAGFSGLLCINLAFAF
jgi:hypothetical protein